MHSEAIDNVAKALPGKHVYKGIRHIICHGRVGVGRLNVCERMGKDLRWRPGHAIQVRLGVIVTKEKSKHT